MNKTDLDFLLRYAKDGVLESMKQLDAIEREELKQEYFRIKSEAISNHRSVDGTPQKEEKGASKGQKDEGAFTKWLHGIGGRQKKYQTEHKDDVI